jgi:hypothetical protein
MLHTDIPTEATLRHLATLREPFSVSIYLPTSPIPSHMDEARIELRNQLDDAAAQLADAGASRAQIEELEDAIVDLSADSQFWQYLSHSLVIFVTAGHVQTFRVPSRLPAALEVSDRLYIKPLVRSVTFPQAAFVLALSENAARLVEVSASEGAFTVDVTDLPQDAASAVGLESISGRSPSGRIQGSEGRKVRLGQYSRSVDAAIRPILNGSVVPLILATTEPLDGIYRGVNNYTHLAAETIRGNPDELSDESLAASARPILDALYAEALEVIKEHVSSRFAQGTAVTDLSDIARAATFGAIDTLLFDMDTLIPGFIDEQSGAITFSDTEDAHSYGVVDEIVRRALLTGARVLAVRAEDVPGGGSAAATVRFPV